jgi:hypothetical protein
MLICNRCGYPATKGTVRTIIDPQNDVTEKGRPLYVHSLCGGTFRSVSGPEELELTEEQKNTIDENLRKLREVLNK